MLKTSTHIGLFDLETSYMILTDFTLSNKGYISHENILQDWSIYCGAFKFLDNPKVVSFCVDPKDPTNDKELCLKLREYLVETKLLIGHNLDKFDLKKFNTRLIKHGIPPLNHKILTLDTLKAAKKHFAFASNRLDYLAKFLGVNPGGKMPHSDGSPWAKLIRGVEVKKTLHHMVEYCKYDVAPLLEGVYLKMRPYIDHPKLGGAISDTNIYCQHCGSTELMSRGTRLTQAGRLFRRYQCKERHCMGWTDIKESEGIEILVGGKAA